MNCLASEQEIEIMKNASASPQRKLDIKSTLNRVMKKLLYTACQFATQKGKDIKVPKVLTQASKSAELIKVSTAHAVIKDLEKNVPADILPPPPSATDDRNNSAVRAHLRAFMRAFRESHDQQPMAASGLPEGNADSGGGAGSQQQCTPS